MCACMYRGQGLTGPASESMWWGFVTGSSLTKPDETPAKVEVQELIVTTNTTVSDQWNTPVEYTINDYNQSLRVNAVIGRERE